MDEPSPKQKSSRRTILGGSIINSAGTLVSRLLGMVRDMATAALLGMSQGGVMDCFVLAFRIPNLFRTLFGEGALTASYLPVFTKQWEEDPKKAWKLASVVAAWLAAILLGLVLVGETVCGLLWYFGQSHESVLLVARLLAVMMPYLLFICLAALATATLHTRGHFLTPAFVPTILNVTWLIGAFVIAPRVAEDQAGQAAVLGMCVVVAGSLQLAVQIPVLYRFGFRWDYDWRAAGGRAKEIARNMIPMLVGLTITQLNGLLDSLIAWGLAGPLSPTGEATPITWLGGIVDYPMRLGAAAALYYGERLYMFPWGVVGIAVATAVFPMLARHAARGEMRKLGEDLTLGLRLVAFLAIPASAGLAILSEPLARMLYQYGDFTSDDAVRTGHVIIAYGVGCWSYCALPLLVRGFYATEDWTTPVKVGVVAAGINLVMNLTFVWPFEEVGLAAATCMSSVIQLTVLTTIFARRFHSIRWSPLIATALRALAASLAMACVGWLVLTQLPMDDAIAIRLARVFAPMACCVVTYMGVYHLLGGRELQMLMKFRKGGEE